MKAIDACKVFFGSHIKVAAHRGFESEAVDEETDEPEYDEYHPKATRTLFCGNLESHTSGSLLRDTFRRFGEIVVSRIE